MHGQSRPYSILFDSWQEQLKHTIYFLFNATGLKNRKQEKNKLSVHPIITKASIISTFSSVLYCINGTDFLGGLIESGNIRKAWIKEYGAEIFK
jgi:hypothetical protein